jgi:hypothetical protein
MNKEIILQNYFSTSGNIDIFLFFSDMVFTTVLSFILGMIYIKFGSSISNKKSFAGNFTLLALTTFLVISIIKSSLALSLGLVGALSIVRFRAAIKEPEELVYLFLCISVGLGFGAEQRYITLLAFSLIIVILILRGLIKRVHPEFTNLFVKFNTEKNPPVEDLLSKLKKYSQISKVRRLDHKDNQTEILFGAQFKSTKNLLSFKEDLIKNYKDAEISFYEDKGIVN